MGAEAHPSAACPDDEVLALLVDGSLEPAEDAAVRAHLDACDACRVLFADVARALDSGIGARGAPRAAPTEHNFHKGDIFAGRYRIDRLLGKGGMGQVFAARHIELNKLVALKVMRPDMTRDPDAVKRFAREAKSAAALRSEHAVRILDVGRIDDAIPYIVMEHLDGHDLGSIAPKTLPIPDAVRYVRQACDALIDAHAVGIIHRDLKPHNLFLTRDAGGAPFIKVLDFGLAKARGDWKGPQDSSNTATNVMLGSPFFMSPEQIESAKSVDHRTDIWSLGATLYQLLTGGPPFLAPNVHIICARILTEDFPPAKSKRPEVPKDLEEILRRCMNRDLSARYQTVTELVKALDRLLNDVDETINNGKPLPSFSKVESDGMMLDPPTVVLAGSLEPATPPLGVPHDVSDDPTVGNEPWRSSDWRRPLTRDDTTATNQMIVKPPLPPKTDLPTLPAVVPTPPQPIAPAVSVKDTIPENRPPVAVITPFDLGAPQRISTLPMPGSPASPVQIGAARMALIVLGFVAIAAGIVAASLWSHSDPTPPIALPTAEPSATAAAATTVAPPPTTAPATTPIPVATTIAAPSPSASIAAAPPRTVVVKPPPPPPPPKKPPGKPGSPSTVHDPYANP